MLHVALSSDSLVYARERRLHSSAEKSAVKSSFRLIAWPARLRCSRFVSSALLVENRLRSSFFRPDQFNKAKPPSPTLPQGGAPQPMPGKLFSNYSQRRLQSNKTALKHSTSPLKIILEQSTSSQPKKQLVPGTGAGGIGNPQLVPGNPHQLRSSESLTTSTSIAPPLSLSTRIISPATAAGFPAPVLVAGSPAPVAGETQNATGPGTAPTGAGEMIFNEDCSQPKTP